MPIEQNYLRLRITEFLKPQRLLLAVAFTVAILAGRPSLAAAQSFTLAPASPTLTLVAGNGGTDTIAITPNNGFSGTVTLSETGIPAGINYTFLSSSSTSSILVVYVPSGATSGSYPVTITGVSGNLSATATMTLVIPQQSQTISFGAIPAQAVGTTLTVSATATSGLPVKFTVVPNGNCSISGTTVTFLNVGNCGVVANQAGNASYTAAPAVGQIVVVNAAPPPPASTATAVHSTVCQANGSASYCSDQTPAPADANGYHDLTWVNLNKSLASIAVSDDQVWGLDASGVLWFLPNFKSGTSWTMVASGVTQISAGHNLLCQINSNQHVYCSASPNPLLSQPDANGFQSISWVDTGATNLRQISVSTGTQFWAIDTSANLIQVKDYRNLSATSTMVAAGVQQVAVDGRGVVCQVNSDKYVYCSNWSVPSSSAQGSYYGLPWVKTTAQLANIAVADGQVVGTDSNGDVWQLPDYTNSSTWYRIAYGGASDRLSAASVPSQFLPTNFATGEVAVLFFMGQSNAVGYNTLPSRFISPSSPNVWGVTNGGWNFLPGNTNGTTPFTGAISSINSVQWSNYAMTASGPDMNLGFNNNAGPGGDAANFAAYQWQGLINAGWQLPDLYIVHIAWPSQGVDAADTTTASAAWTTHGVNLWQPGLAATSTPSYALAPFARQITWLALQKILASGKTPRVLGLQWNQWEAEAGNSNSVSISDAPTNYSNLMGGFYSALGSHFPIQFAKPLSTAYGSSALTQMQSVFANLASGDPSDYSVIDVSQTSSTIFSGGVLGGGDGLVHYNLDTQQWFAAQAIGSCVQQANCGTRIAALPTAAPN
ncbi:tectonin domain-containing protein [Granulicella aggregans]|uniref:tectonin domain-containing protein n=1 Tax=Granulicella aggregans TaxID=474949 RepID=UPI0021DFE576|nr:tectonin domain-containing protein [Granulicella aggregans]